MTVIIPTTKHHVNDASQPIFWIEGAARGNRTPDDLRLLVIHHTAGTDSRSYLARNALNSSTTYLVGSYPDAGGVRVYKYMSESSSAPFTQGFGSIGSVANINRSSIAIECEGGVPQSNGELFLPDVVEQSAILAASILRYWSARGIDLLLVAHKHVDKRKSDPAFDWSDFCKLVYAAV